MRVLVGVGAPVRTRWSFFCFIYVKSTLFSCVCQSHFRRPQGYFSCKLSRKTFFFLSKLIRPHKTGTSSGFFKLPNKKRALAIARALFHFLFFFSFPSFFCNTPFLKIHSLNPKNFRKRLLNFWGLRSTIRVGRN